MKKISQRWLITSLLLPAIYLSSCQTKEDDERDRRILLLQKGIIQLKNKVKKENKANLKTGRNLSMNLAESQVNQEEASRDLQNIKGDLQAIQHFLGVTGLKPDELTLKSLDNRFLALEKKLDKFSYLEERIKNLNETQNKILENLENLVKTRASKKVSTKKAKQREKLKSLAEAEKAYREKRYLHIVEDFSFLTAKSKKTNKLELSYLHARSLFKLGRISAAALAFDELLKAKNLGTKASKVYLRLGDCFRLLGDKKTALIYYEELLSKYPKSSEVEIAKDYLKKLKTKEI